MAEPTRRSGLGRGLDALIPTGPREPGRLLPPYEDPVSGRIDELVDEVHRLGERVDELVRATAASARRGLWHRRCGAGLARVVGAARSGAGQVVGIGASLILDVTDLAIGTARDLLEVALGAVRLSGTGDDGADSGGGGGGARAGEVPEAGELRPVT